MPFEWLKTFATIDRYEQNIYNPNWLIGRDL